MIALLAAIASLIVAVITAGLAYVRDRQNAKANRELLAKQQQLELEVARYKADLDQQVRDEERELSARAELDRVREPSWWLPSSLEIG